MADGRRVNPRYRGLADGKGEREPAAGARSDTQYEIMELAPGERWGLEATQDAYRAGGNENSPDDDANRR